jgi:hypothetical protein
MRCSKRQLFNDLVGAREQRWRHIDAEHLCCGQVDDEIKLGRPLDRQIGRLSASRGDSPFRKSCEYTDQTSRRVDNSQTCVADRKSRVQGQTQ